MKKLTLLMMAIVMGLAAIAQKNETRKQDHNNKHKQHKNKAYKGNEKLDNVNLTNEQKEQVKSINENFKQQMRDLRNQGNITVAEQKQRRETLVREHKEKLASVLTPEQRRNAESNSGFKGRKGSDRGDRFNDLSKDLNLSADQSQRMSTLNSTFKSNMKNIRENSSLSQEQKKEQMKNLMRKHRSDMESLLTNDQKEQLKNKQKNRPNRTAVK